MYIYSCPIYSIFGELVLSFTSVLHDKIVFITTIIYYSVIYVKIIHSSSSSMPIPPENSSSSSTNVWIVVLREDGNKSIKILGKNLSKKEHDAIFLLDGKEEKDNIFHLSNDAIHVECFHLWSVLCAEDEDDEYSDDDRTAFEFVKNDGIQCGLLLDTQKFSWFDWWEQDNSPSSEKCELVIFRQY